MGIGSRVVFGGSLIGGDLLNGGMSSTVMKNRIMRVVFIRPRHLASP